MLRRLLVLLFFVAWAGCDAFGGGSDSVDFHAYPVVFGAYVSSVSGTDQGTPPMVYALSLDGDLIEVTQGLYPDFSPDGRSMTLLGSEEFTHSEGTYVTATDPIDPRALVYRSPDDPVFGEVALALGRPSWSPDGTQVVASADGTFLSSGCSNVLDLAVVDVATGTHECMGLASDQNDTWPAWSPDGSLIAFSRASQVGDRPFGIFLVRPDGTDLRPLVGPTTDTAPWQPSWSPDGTRVIYQTLPGRRDSEPGLWSVEVATGETEQIDLGLPTGYYPLGSFHWLPGGHEVLFVGLKLRPTSDGGVTTFSPLGSRIYRYRFSDGRLQTLFEHDGEIYGLDWYPGATPAD